MPRMISTLQNDLLNALFDDDKKAALAVIEKLKEGEVDFAISFKNPPNKLTPLLYASESQELGAEVVGALLAKGANTKARDSFGRNALHYAQDFDQFDVGKVLVCHDPLLRTLGDSEGSTPLHEAALDNKLGFLNCYLNLHIDDVYIPCDVNIRNHQQETPLHQASKKGHTIASKWLMQKGASADARDNSSDSPFHYAKALSGISSAHKEIARCLAPRTIPTLFTLTATKIFELYSQQQQAINQLMGEFVLEQPQQVALLYQRHLKDVNVKEQAVQSRREPLTEKFKKLSLQ